MKKEISKIVLDGEEFDITEDKETIKSSTKEFSKAEFRKEKGEKMKFFIVPPEAETEGTMYGFSNEEKFEEWLKEKDLLERYEKHKEVLKHVRKEKSKEEVEKIKQFQLKEVQVTTERYSKFLEKHNLKQDEFDKIKEVIEKQDPHFKPQKHSLYLYEHTLWWGRSIVLPGGTWYWDWIFLKCSPRAYGDLRWFGFDNIASSLSLCGSASAYLYNEPWYRGACLIVFWHIANLHWVSGACFGDTISSAIVY